MNPSYRSLAVVGAAFVVLCFAAFQGISGAQGALITAAGLLVTWFAQPPNGPGGLGASVPFDLPKGEPTLSPVPDGLAQLAGLALAIVVMSCRAGGGIYQDAAVYQSQLMACVASSKTQPESKACRERVMASHGRHVDAGAP